MPRRERGSMLVELIISMMVLAVGLGGVMVLLVLALNTNGKATNDTTSVMVAEHVLEQISAQPANATALLLRSRWKTGNLRCSLGSHHHDRV